MKFMNMKRFASIVMACVMTLSLAVPAFASASVEITGTYEEQEIAVVVSESAEAQINPYGLPVKLTKSTKDEVQLVDQQITSTPLSIKNQSTIPMDVSVSSFVVEPAGDLEIAASKDTGKKVQLTLEVAALNDNAFKVATNDKAATTTLEDALMSKYADDATWSGLTAANKVDAPAATKGTKAAAITGATKATIATVGAATEANKVITYGAKSIALFRLKGDLATDPKDSSNKATPWTDADGFTATIVFTFKPAAKLAITIGTITGGTVTASPSSAWEGTEVTLTGTPTTANQTAAFTVTKTGDNSTSVTVINGKFTMPEYPVTVTATFS